MRLLLSLSVALLLLAGSTVLVRGFSPAARRALVHSSYRVSVETMLPLPLKATIDRQSVTFMMKPSQQQGIAEAKQCLADIEGAVQTARGYLYYLEEVAQTVKGYLESKTTGNINTSAVKEYLVNIEKAASSAQEYLQYLEGVAASVREYLSQMETFTPQEKDAEKKTRSILADLEETAQAAREYLAYLQGVASAVQQFLATPTSPAPPELANLLGGTPPKFPVPPTLPTPPILQTLTPPTMSTGPSAPVVASTQGAINGEMAPAPAGRATISLGKPPEEPAVPQASGSGTGRTPPAPVPAAVQPAPPAPVPAAVQPAPPAPVPAYQPPAPQAISATSTGSYLDNISSSASSARPSGKAMQTFADSLQPGISASVALDKRDKFATKGIKSYTDSLGGDKVATSSTKKGPSSYLDSLETTSVKDAEKQVDGVVGPGAAGIFFLFFVLFLSLAQFLLPLPDEYLDRFFSLPEPVEQVMQPASPTVDAEEVIKDESDLDDWSF